MDTLRVLLAWLLMSLLDPCLGAYVQIKDCFDDFQANSQSPIPRRIVYDSLRVYFEPPAGDHGAVARLVSLVSHPEGLSCAEFDGPHISSNLDARSLATRTYPGQLTNFSCNLTGRLAKLWWIETVHDIDQLSPLDTFAMTLSLRDAQNTPLTCVKFPLTPSLSMAEHGWALYFPIAVFCLVIVVAMWQEISNLGSGHRPDDTSIGELSRSHITRIADCLSFIQFVFFSSALGLSYPGFLQPVTSVSSWSTLVFPTGPVKKSHFFGVRDGIYAVNGTFGGTDGLTLMSQVMGAPITQDIWINIVSLAAILLVVLSILVFLGQTLTWSRDWFRASNSITTSHGSGGGIKDVLWVVLRLLLSYMLLPIVVWSSYQLSVTWIRPVYYSVVVGLVVVTLILAMWWGMVHSDPMSLGYLVIDGGKDPRELQTGLSTADVYTVGLFSLQTLRGVAFGALQIEGVAQLSLLAGCEVTQFLLAKICLGTWKLGSTSSILSLLRLFILFILSMLLVAPRDHQMKMVIGYGVLAIHSIVLVGMFFIPALHRAYKIIQKRVGSEEPNDEVEDGFPEAYRLRQLRHTSDVPNSEAEPHENTQPTHRNNIALNERWRPQLAAAPRLSRMSRVSDSSSGSTQGSSYFRPPRVRVQLADDGVKESVAVSSPARGDSASFEDGERLSTSLPTALVAEEPVDGEAWRACVPSPVGSATDYTFREADLFYHAPRTLEFGSAQEPQEGGRSSIISSWMARFRRAKGDRATPE
ncbi:hypothetical protein B0I35DRAFT_201814 [Stachybotrys elegans]|uniref:TRP C-terminal domain-containing protein n=1 Tax=Stachybotrys elegans TaxID=80388 RepID=A0A8K0WSJ2_9HYPO|nr:hypothetical protein B0I35DRAFT_201814 [Stachybotrys elegans]